MTRRIDLHCHLIPGIDDGCVLPEHSIQSVEALIARGYGTSVLTPHIWPDMYPGNIPRHVDHWAGLLRKQLADHGLDYTLIVGGEVRLFEGAIGWFKRYGVPTLGDSKAVLVDSWDRDFPQHGFETIDWLIAEGYKPVLAHPERGLMGEKLEQVISALTSRGVLFQGNFQPFTGRDMPGSEALAWRFLEEGLYAVLALDLHRPDSLESRLAGIDVVEARIGKDALDQLIVDNPRRLLADEPTIPAPKLK